MFSSLLNSSQTCGKNPKGSKKQQQQSQSKLMVTLCLTANRSYSVAPSTLSGFINELKMNNLDLSAIIACDVLCIPCWRGEETWSWIEEDKKREYQWKIPVVWGFFVCFCLFFNFKLKCDSFPAKPILVSNFTLKKNAIKLAIIVMLGLLWNH